MFRRARTRESGNHDPHLDGSAVGLLRVGVGVEREQAQVRSLTRGPPTGRHDLPPGRGCHRGPDLRSVEKRVPTQARQHMNLRRQAGPHRSHAAELSVRPDDDVARRDPVEGGPSDAEKLGQERKKGAACRIQSVGEPDRGTRVLERQVTDAELAALVAGVAGRSRSEALRLGQRHILREAALPKGFDRRVEVQNMPTTAVGIPVTYVRTGEHRAGLGIGSEQAIHEAADCRVLQRAEGARHRRCGRQRVQAHQRSEEAVERHVEGQGEGTDAPATTGGQVDERESEQRPYTVASAPRERQPLLDPLQKTAPL